MKIEDIDWLLHTFPNHRGRTIRGEVLAAYYKAEMLLNGWDKEKKRSCGCQLRSLADGVDKLYNKWLHNNEETLHNKE
jgi:hypothetical protein